jgi:hypothetical protein
MSAFKRVALRELQDLLPSLGDSKVAFGAQAYMKGVAPFIGIRAPERRKVAKELAKKLPRPTSDELGETARAISLRYLLIAQIRIFSQTMLSFLSLKNLGGIR